MPTKPPSRSTRKKNLRKQVPESLLARLWRERAVRQQNLRTTEGRRVKVLYPGRPGTEAGPDFRDALILREGEGLVRGDVELHLHPKDWDRHGHAADHRYNGVVLHGVLAPPDAPQPLPGGGAAPAVPLQSLLEPSINSDHKGKNNQRSALWALLKSLGYPKPATRSVAFSLLERAGVARFIQKTASFESLIKELGAEEALYQALMESLGYSENRAGFLELARHVPHQALLKAVSEYPPSMRPHRIEEILLRIAGFAEGGKKNVMDRGNWRHFRIRPANHPRRRIAGAAILLHRTSPPGLVASALQWMHSGSFNTIVQGLTVPHPSHGPALIGRSRAQDMAVNVLLPFVHAYYASNNDDALAEASLRLYVTAPRLQPNRITREMADVLFPKPWRPLASGTAHQQGLIHLHRLLQGEG